jgi:hypothetical protein
MSAQPKPANATHERRRGLTDVPLDLLGEVYAFQAALQQAALRATCVRLADAFDGAVRNELVDAAIVRGGGAGVDVTESAVSGLRSTRMCPTSGAEITGGAFRDFLLVNDAGKFTRRSRAPNAEPSPLAGNVVRLEIVHFGDMPTTLQPLSFLHRATRLRHIAICSKLGSASMRALGANVLANCTLLATATIANLIALESIGASCLKGCVSLKSVSFDNLPALTSVGDDWLEGCQSLTRATFTRMPALTSVGDCFLQHCLYLEEVDFGQLSNLQRVGRRWLGECVKLRHVNYAGLESLETVADGWMYGCRALREVRLVGLHSLTTIGFSFLSHCAALKVLIIHDALQLEEIGNYWLSNCPALTTVDTRGLSRFHRLGGTAFDNCGSLKLVNLSDAVLIRPGTTVHDDICWHREGSGGNCVVLLPSSGPPPNALGRRRHQQQQHQCPRPTEPLTVT